MRRFALAFVLATGLVPLAIGSAAPARACAIDGVPSAFANGIRAVIFKGAPTAATYSYWARFAFPSTYRAGRRIAFNEDDKLVRPVLKLADLAHSWRWRYGDGGADTGDRVAHRYQRPGRYRVAVDAYFPSYGGWQQFDSITITMQK